MYPVKHPTIPMLARAIDLRTPTAFKDSLVMAVGTGLESTNHSAIIAWLCARHQVELPLSWYIPLEDLIEMDFAAATDEESEAFHVFLRTQCERLWEGGAYPYPTLEDYLFHLPLSRDECRLMSHGLIEMLARGQRFEFVIARCEAMLPGTENGVKRLTDWVAAQQAVFNHHPSELTLPLAHDLLRVLYPDFTPVSP